MGRIADIPRSGEMVGPVVIESGGDVFPEPILWSKACRQLGIPSEFQEEKAGIRVRLPVMPLRTYETVVERVGFLQKREAQGLPVEPLHDGTWPESSEEYADSIPLIITKDEEKKSVYIDFGRPIHAIGVSPTMARTLAVMMMTVANELDPDGMVTMGRPELVSVGRLKVSDEEKEKVGIISLPGILGELKGNEEQGNGS